MDGTHPHVELAEDWVIQQNSRQLGWAVSSFPAVSSSPPEHLPRHPHLPGLDTYHQCLEVVLASKADRDGTVILRS
jgi:hypothetical protein